MCQAMEAEAEYLRSTAAWEMRAARALQGRLSRQDGAPRQAWHRLVGRVRLDVPDSEGTPLTPAWWAIAPSRGDEIGAWLAGWDDEDRRIAAGGPPLDAAERAALSADLGFLDGLARDIAQGPAHCEVGSRDVERFSSFLEGELPPPNDGRGYRLDRDRALSAIACVRASLSTRLRPHGWGEG